jgi:translation initiation factor 1A
MYQTSIRKKKKNFNTSKNSNYDINFEYEEYGLVKKLLGNCRVNLICNSGDEVMGIIRGNMRKFNKRVLIDKGDIVVISKREYQANKVDIVHKISSDKYSEVLNSVHFSNVLKNEYYNITNTSSNNKETYINFSESGSDISDNETYNSLRFLNINDENSDSDNNIEIDNI